MSEARNSVPPMMHFRNRSRDVVFGSSSSLLQSDRCSLASATSEAAQAREEMQRP